MWWVLKKEGCRPRETSASRLGLDVYHDMAVSGDLSGEQTYKSLKSQLRRRRKNSETPKPQDVYKCASLLTRWDSNGTLPFCMLCQDPKAKKIRQVGHLIPYSVLQKLKGNMSIDMVRGVPIGIRHTGYRVFCPDCEKRFSDGGEKVFAPKMIQPLVENIGLSLEVDTVDIPQVYYCIISIVWRCLAIIREGANRFLELLEKMRHFLLMPTEEKDKDLPSIGLCAPNKEVLDEAERGGKGTDALLNMAVANIGQMGRSDLRAEFLWIVCGPLHIMAFLKDAAGLSAQLGVNQLKMSAKKFKLDSVESRFFPVVMLKWLIKTQEGAEVASLRVPERKEVPTQGSDLDPVEAASRVLLPDNVSYDKTRDEFEFPDYYKKEVEDRSVPDGRIHCVGFTRGGRRGCFVAIIGGLSNGGHVCMALEVEGYPKVEDLKWLRCTNIPPAERTSLNLDEPLFKDTLIPYLTQLYSALAL